jgi:hypothetical protein
MHSIDQPTADINAISESFDICQPVGLGPGTNAMFWVAVPPVAAVAVTSAVTTGPFSSMFAMTKDNGNLPSAFDPADAALNEGRLACGQAGRAERLQRLEQWSLQVWRRCLRHRDVPHDRLHCRSG